MYAIICSGGKQYKVKVGDVVRVEKLDKDLDSEFDVTEVLFVGGKEALMGQPHVDGAKVRVCVTGHSRATKIHVFKKNRRQGYRRTQGHRQDYTELLIKEISSPNGEVSRMDSEGDSKKKAAG